MIADGLIPVRLAWRCWYTVLHLLTADELVGLHGTSAVRRRAPHGFAYVPSYTGDYDDEGNHIYSTTSGWRYEPRRIAGCACEFCQRFPD